MIQETIRRLPSNAIHNFVALLLPVAVSLAATPYIVHRLGEEQFGLYMLVLSVVGFGGLIDLGVGAASVKFVAESRARGDAHELSKLVNSLITSRLPFAAGLIVVGYAFAPLIGAQILLVSPALLPEAAFLIRTAVSTVAVSLVGGTLAALPRAAHRYDMVGLASLLFSLALTGATVWLVSAGRGLREIVLAELVLACLSLVVSAIQARRTIPEWRYRPELDLESLRRLLVFGAYVAIGTLTGFLFAHANRILVGRALGIAAVAYYSIAWNVSARVVQLVYALAEVITPLASALAAKSEVGTLRTLYTRASRLTAATALSAVVPVFVGAADLLWLWLGASFADRSATTLRILVLSTGIQSLGAVAYMMLNGMGHPARAMVPTVIGASTNIFLGMFLGERLGLAGIALAVCCGFIVQTFLLTRAMDRLLDMPQGFARTIMPVLIAAAAGIAAGSAVASMAPSAWLRLLFSSAVSLAASHGLLLVFGWYERREVEFLWHALRSSAPHGAGRDEANRGKDPSAATSERGREEPRPGKAR